ncbi:hypothetical protein D3C87_2178380 [compost metagenome]
MAHALHTGQAKGQAQRGVGVAGQPAVGCQLGESGVHGVHPFQRLIYLQSFAIN